MTRHPLRRLGFLSKRADNINQRLLTNHLPLPRPRLVLEAGLIIDKMPSLFDLTMSAAGPSSEEIAQIIVGVASR
jgi:hypothetical protein